MPLPHNFLCEAREGGLDCSFSLILPLILNNYFFMNSYLKENLYVTLAYLNQTKM